MTGNAIYPLELMPDWLKLVALFNPLTYLLDVLIGLMIEGGRSMHSLPLDFGVMAIVFLSLMLIAASLYPELAR